MTRGHPERGLRIGIVAPHIFMNEAILPSVIFSPGRLALDLAAGLNEAGAEVTLYSPGPVQTRVHNITADLSYFERELAGRGDSYIALLKKHPLTFITLARQVQAELIARAYADANRGALDIVHIYTNEEELALPFAALCNKPVVFTHHDPFNFLIKYKNNFPKYADLNWLSISLSQRHGMPAGTNWVGNIYHGMDPALLSARLEGSSDYVAYLGRIIEPKGVHLAIAAVRMYNRTHPKRPLKLLMAGKHYSGGKDSYWQEQILPQLDDEIQYVGFIDSARDKQAFLGGAQALIIPSTFEEPFGVVMIEALACGTPLVGLDSGAIGEIIRHGKTGRLVPKANPEAMITGLAQAISTTNQIDRRICRKDFEARFTLERMAREHLMVYQQLI